MGVFTFTDEYTSSIPPARLFKALIVDSNNVIPKLMPQVVKSIEFIEGDGGAGSIRQINFAEGSQLSSIKNRIDEFNEETFTYKYTLVEGGPVPDKIESISYEVKFEATSDGGSKNKMTSIYYTKGDIELHEEGFKAAKERALKMYQLCEAYLIKNPDAYA